MNSPITRSCMRSVFEKHSVRRTNRFMRVRRLMCLLSIFHIPPDFVVDGAPQRVKAAHVVISHCSTPWGRQTNHKITPTISRAWHFTTQSGGVCYFIHQLQPTTNSDTLRDITRHRLTDRYYACELIPSPGATGTQPSAASMIDR